VSKSLEPTDFFWAISSACPELRELALVVSIGLGSCSMGNPELKKMALGLGCNRLRDSDGAFAFLLDNARALR
jgi:hypothetical protein